jgi:CelD/BcsL family acetyltransferase involved in cellulose biosynthesis
MNIVSVSPEIDPLWQDLIEQRRSDVFHSPGWMRVLTETYDFQVQAYVVLDEAGHPVTGIPFCHIKDFQGERLVALPFSDYCDPLVGEPAHWRLLLDKLLAEQVPLAVRPLHCDTALTDERLAMVNQAKWHGMDLRPDLDTLWRGLHSSARRAIRKAEGTGVVIRTAECKEDLRAFFELHLGVRKYKYHLVAQPYRFFESIWDHFVENGRGFLKVAVHQDEIIGGVLFLAWKDKLYYKFNASAPTHLSLRPNDLVVWNGIRFGKTKGYTYLDFGLSDWDQEGLVGYERKFATEEKTISFLRYSPNRTPTEGQIQLRGLLSQMTDLFTDEAVPDTVTEKAGDILYQFFC